MSPPMTPGLPNASEAPRCSAVPFSRAGMFFQSGDIVMRSTFIRIVRFRQHFECRVFQSCDASRVCRVTAKQKSNFVRHIDQVKPCALCGPDDRCLRANAGRISEPTMIDVCLLPPFRRHVPGCAALQQQQRPGPDDAADMYEDHPHLDAEMTTAPGRRHIRYDDCGNRPKRPSMKGAVCKARLRVRSSGWYCCNMVAMCSTVTIGRRSL